MKWSYYNSASTLKDINSADTNGASAVFKAAESRRAKDTSHEASTAGRDDPFLGAGVWNGLFRN
jgi:hypothetical protein